MKSDRDALHEAMGLLTLFLMGGPPGSDLRVRVREFMDRETEKVGDGRARPPGPPEAETIEARDRMWCAALLCLDPREIAAVTGRFLQMRSGAMPVPWSHPEGA